MMNWPSYDSLIQQPSQRDPLNRGYVTDRDQNFFTLRRHDADARARNGWKVHLSMDPRDTALAWDGIASLAIDAGVDAAKVVDPQLNRTFALDDYIHAGKMITLYGDERSVDWKALLQGIEDRLGTQGIRPGHRVSTDRRLPGSSYASYRNDRLIGNDRTVIGEPPRHNPSLLPDPFEGMQLQPALPQLHWQRRRDQLGRDLRDYPVAHMARAGIETIDAALRHHGYKPEQRISQSLGPVVYLSGSDVAKLDRALDEIDHESQLPLPMPSPPPTGERKAFLKDILEAPAGNPDLQYLAQAGNWVRQMSQDSIPILSLPIAGMSHEKVSRVEALLKGGQLNYRPVYRQSASLGGEVLSLVDTEARDFYARIEPHLRSRER